MKNINHIGKEAFRYIQPLFLIILFCSFTPHNTLTTTSCHHDFVLKDSYSIKKPETVIVKALKDYGFDVKRGLEDLNEGNHTWRLLNVKTKYGIVNEITIQIDGEGTEVFPTTTINLVKLCLDEELTNKELDSKIKKYRAFFKKNIINKLKKYKG